MTLVLFQVVTFNGYDSCMHGENIEPWNLWADFTDSDCKARTHSHVEDEYDRMEKLCLNKRTAAAHRASRLFSSEIVRILMNERSCERAAAFIRHQQVEDEAIAKSTS